MSKTRYIYIDDENDGSITSLINGFNDTGLIEVNQLSIQKGLSFSVLESLIKSKIRDGQLYQLVFTNGVQGLANRYYINNDYLLENIHYEIVTKSINETLNFIQQHNGENLHFDMARSNNFAKEKAGLINPDLFD
jgi:hypothetical protein